MDEKSPIPEKLSKAPAIIYPVAGDGSISPAEAQQILETAPRECEYCHQRHAAPTIIAMKCAEHGLIGFVVCARHLPASLITQLEPQLHRPSILYVVGHILRERAWQAGERMPLQRRPTVRVPLIPVPCPPSPPTTSFAALAIRATRALNLLRAYWSKHGASTAPRAKPNGGPSME